MLERHATMVAAALLIAMAALCVLGARAMSASADESTHIAAGYSYWKTGDFRMNPQHPPFGKLLAGLPLLALDPPLDTATRAWKIHDEWSFADAFLYAAPLGSPNDADAILFAARLPLIGLALLLGATVFAWSRELYGPRAALLSLGLYAFSPTIIAHARFVTFDVPLATFFAIAHYHLWRYLRGGRRRDAIVLGLSTGSALATKYSAALMSGSLLLIVALWLWRGRPGSTLRERWRMALVAGAATLLFSAFCILASYLFTGSLLDYWEGLSRVNADHNPDYPFYLNGEFRTGGWWYYVLVAFLVKTPLVTLGLLGLAGVAAVRTRRPWLDDACLVVPIVVFTAGTCVLSNNLGIRYLTPVYPLLFVFIGRLVPDAAERVRAGSGFGKQFGSAVAAFAAVGYVGSALWIHPDSLAYFNAAVGGPAKGYRYLDDSNIAWGQDAKRLAAYLAARGNPPIKLKPFSGIDPSHYGVDWQEIGRREWSQDPPPGLYGLSTHQLVRGEYYARRYDWKTDWLSRYEPVARIGYSIYLFEFEAVAP